MRAQATEIRTGDRVTYCGATFVAAHVEFETRPGLLRVDVSGAMAQYIAPFREVVIERVTPVEKPYFVVTRDYDDKGNCDKRTFRFRTAKAQSSFINRTNRCITFCN